MTVPGPVTSVQSAGCHQLIRLGAQCVTCGGRRRLSRTAAACAPSAFQRGVKTSMALVLRWVSEALAVSSEVPHEEPA